MIETKHKRRLFALNLAMCLVHAGLAGTVLIRANTGLRVPLYDTELLFDPEPDGGFRLLPRHVEVSALGLTWVVVFFFACSSVAHLGHCWLWREWYLRHLEKAMCPTRWIEYFFSASAMIVVIAYTSGTRSTVELVSLTGLIATTMTFGWLNEVINRPHPVTDEWQLGFWARSQAHLLGYVPMCVAWFCVLYTFFSSTRDTPCGPPDFVYYIVVGEAVMFSLFVVPQLYQVLSPPSKYYVGEYAYQFLSLAAKTLLGIVLLVNVLAYDSFDASVTGESGSGEAC